MEIYLIRHTSVDVPMGICYGQADVPLKKSFKQEATVVAKKIKKYRFDKVFVSPLSRCVKLADFCGYPDATRDERILELNFGAWEMRKWNEIDDPRLSDWFNNYFHIPPTGGESFMQQSERVAAFLDEVRKSSAKRIGVFTHAGVIICAQTYAGMRLRSETFVSGPPYGSITKLTF